MNKKIFSYMTVAAMAAAGLSSCSEEQTLPVGEGTIYISTRVNSDVVVESRAEAEEELAASTKVWIYSSEGVVRKFNGMSEIPVTGLKLISGEYTIKAWAGKAEYASFDSRWFEGQTAVEVRPGEPQAVEVVCKIANVVASVQYPENIDELITDYSMTIGHKGGALTFEGNDPEKKGYYMMPEGVTTLDYTLSFTTTDGEAKSAHGIIENVAPAHQYILNVIANQEEDNDGAAFITIEVDESPLEEITESIVITTPPSITGYGFDINAPVAGESGSIGRKSVYVCAASEITELEVSGTELPGFDPFNFIHAVPAQIEELKGKGISTEVADVPNGQMIKVIFDDTYLNTLPNRDEPYVFTITATDKGDKTATAKLTLRISEAPVFTAPIAENAASYTSATVSATIAKDGIESAGFEYALVGTEDWQYIEGAASRAAFTKGQVYYATITDLEVCADYKYRAVTEHGTDKEYIGEEQEFTTLNGPQLPNSSFENWRTDADKALVPMPSDQDFWDSGNHGSITLNVNLTQSVTEYKHSGKYGVQLKSQKVSLLGIGAFAAGNVFTGKYIKTEATTNGVVGFGRPFDFPTSEIKPVAIKMWVKYVPTNDWEKKKNDTKIDTPTGYDEGHIFIALFDAPDNGDTYTPEYNGLYGYVVHTENQKRLFDKNASNIIAYGEKVLTESTPGSGLIEITIPYEYYAGKENAQPKLIAVVCTASKYGDYFQGGEGTTMWVDDVEIVYGKK